MADFIRRPYTVLILSFAVMWVSAWIGLLVRTRGLKTAEPSHGDLDLIVAATLTLLGLIIGFSFSMAISRYDQRKNYEEAEANAIGTEYLRADFLPSADAAQARTLLTNYLAQRILFYETRNEDALSQIDSTTAQLQTQLWSTVRGPSGMQPTPILALVASGMNDVLNTQGYTQAAWWNRIPPGAWFLMVTVAVCSNLLVGFDSRRVAGGAFRLMILPFVLCIAFYATADIDSPRRGLIRVHPQNLISLALALSAR